MVLFIVKATLLLFLDRKRLKEGISYVWCQ